MEYSSEVKEMCPLTQGTNHGPSPFLRKVGWTQAKEIKEYPWIDSRRWLVRPSSGSMQADLEY